ncbi:MAG: hypothetical protein HYS18_12575 [Burkholderiales bacterium]|nr:hypothetical protein [Burkholderiales bacterium]
MLKMLAAATCAVWLAGCVSTPSQTDEQFGNAVRAAKAVQTINPEASRNTKAPTGLEGTAAKATMDRYEKSFESPPPPVNVFTIGIGSGTGSGGAGR